MSDHDHELDQAAQRAGEQFRRKEVDVTPEVAQSLAAARRQALAVADKSVRSKPKFWPRLIGASTAAAAAVLVTVALQNPTPSLPQMGDQELAAAQDAELLEELEFVAWMIASESTNELPNAG